MVMTDSVTHRVTQRYMDRGDLAPPKTPIVASSMLSFVFLIQLGQSSKDIVIGLPSLAPMGMWRTGRSIPLREAFAGH
jgi:hypothetical protein